MTELSALKEKSFLAREIWQLIRIATIARSPSHAFRLAERLDWEEDECFSTKMLARIYFEHGQQAFKEIIYEEWEDYEDLLCLCICHRKGRPCGCCNFFVYECFCSCHECPECDGSGWDDSGETLCSYEDHEPCDTCEYRHAGEDEDEERDEINYPHPVAVDAEDVFEEWDSEDDPSSIASKIFNASGREFPVKVVQELSGDRMQAGANPEDRTIYLTQRLVNTLTKDELAWVLAHEVAHFENRDAERRKKAAKEAKEQVKRALQEVDDELKREGKGIIIRSGAFIGTSLLTGFASLVRGQQASQNQEAEADSRALELTKRAGYNPAAGIGALRKISGGDLLGFSDLGMARGTWEALTSSHPSPRKRAENIRRDIEKK